MNTYRQRRRTLWGVISVMSCFWGLWLCETNQLELSKVVQAMNLAKKMDHGCRLVALCWLEFVVLKVAGFSKTIKDVFHQTVSCPNSQRSNCVNESKICFFLFRYSDSHCFACGNHNSTAGIGSFDHVSPRANRFDTNQYSWRDFCKRDGCKTLEWKKRLSV